MFQMQYFVPDGYPRINTPLDDETIELIRKLNGVAKSPKLPFWIHSIPIAYDRLRENEVILCQKKTASFFWAVMSALKFRVTMVEFAPKRSTLPTISFLSLLH